MLSNINFSNFMFIQKMREYTITMENCRTCESRDRSELITLANMPS